MPDVQRTVVELPVPEALREVLVDGWQGTLEIEAEIESVKGGKIMVAVTSVYPVDEAQAFDDMLDEGGEPEAEDPDALEP